MRQPPFAPEHHGHLTVLVCPPAPTLTCSRAEHPGRVVGAWGHRHLRVAVADRRWSTIKTTGPAQQPDSVTDTPQLTRQPPRRPRREAPRRRHRHRLRWVVVGLVVVLGAVAGSMVPALTAPGTDSTTARIAEWARDHGMSPLVTWAEQRTYQPPPMGGAPAADSPLHHQPGSATPGAPGSGLPAPVRTPAQWSSPVSPFAVWKVSSMAQRLPATVTNSIRVARRLV